MGEEKHIIETLANIGVPKETTLEIMHELLFNSSKYSDNQDAIDTMLQEKLGIDLLLSLKKLILLKYLKCIQSGVLILN